MTDYKYYTLIRITRKTKDKLLKFGHKGQTYDDVINQLLDGYTDEYEVKG